MLPAKLSAGGGEELYVERSALAVEPSFDSSYFFADFVVVVG